MDVGSINVVRKFYVILIYLLIVLKYFNFKFNSIFFRKKKMKLYINFIYIGEIKYFNVFLVYFFKFFYKCNKCVKECVCWSDKFV